MILATLGYFKSVEEFKPEKFFHTVLLGAVVGAAAGFTGLTYDQAHEYLLSLGVVSVVEQLEKIVWRRWIKNVIIVAEK